jgi:predicted nuclease of predicted toxin-antitoxin system
MRFHLDEDLSDEIATSAREHFGLDVSSTHLVGMEHATDEEQIAYGASVRRCVVTRNAKDFRPLTAQFLADAIPHPGVVIIPHTLTGREYMRIARGLARLHELYPDDVYSYLVVYLPDVDADDT